MLLVRDFVSFDRVFLELDVGKRMSCITQNVRVLDGIGCYEIDLEHR